MLLPVQSLHLEQAVILDHISYEGGQYYMRLSSPSTASLAKPGNFIHLQCDEVLPMRRPMSIMRADDQAGWIDILYQVQGIGTSQLARKLPQETVNHIGPIGVPFKLKNYKKYPLLIGGGLGIPPIIFLAEHIKKTAMNIKPLVMMGSETPFPFRPQPSKIMMDGLPAGVIAAMPLLEDWGIPSRLSSMQGVAGCHLGYVTDLAQHWLGSLDDNTISEVEIFACGPMPMLKITSQIAAGYDLACEVCLEEYMACAVGGCAGCNVLVKTEQGPSMKRVCVDGPVFEAASVIF